MNKRLSVILAAAVLFAAAVSVNSAAADEADEQLAVKLISDGFVQVFNGKDLAGWKGLVGGNPSKRDAMKPEELAEAQAKADELMRQHWTVVDGVLAFDGKGKSICTVRDYGDFEMVVDWKIEPHGDSGIYLRGSPQVQIWDTADVNVGAEVGSGGLYNNKIGASKPLVKADKPVGEWNRFRIKMVGDKVTVHLNDQLVVDNVVLENYWEREKPIYPCGQIELQAHSTKLYFKNVFIRPIKREVGAEGMSEQEKADGFISLFNGKDLTGWTGNLAGHAVKDGMLIVKEPGPWGSLYTIDEFADFVLRFEFRLAEGGNNGLGIRAPLEGDAAYVGMELQILDDAAEKHSKLKDYQLHGSIYGVLAAKSGYLKPAGEWNCQEVIAKGPLVKVKLNGVTILYADVEKLAQSPMADGKEHPGLTRKSGHIGLLRHGSYVEFKNLRIKKL